MAPSYIYKIYHKESGLFVKNNYFETGINLIADKLKDNPTALKSVLVKSHQGWANPPRCTTEQYQAIGCEVLKYKVTLTLVEE
jgi:hypothetical protein